MTDAKVNIERELELIDGMIEVQLHHAEQCDRIANRTMADKQKGWDMERVALLRKMRAAQPAEPCMDTVLRNAARRSATIVDRGRMVKPVEPVAQVVDDIDGSNKRVIFSSYQARHNTPVWTKLYAAPPAPAAVPMTEEVLNIHKPYYSNIEWPCFKAGVRFAEMVHGTAATTCHVPPGWKLVPIEPTPGMIASGAVALVKASHSDIDPTMEEVTAAYRAMVAAGDKS